VLSFGALRPEKGSGRFAWNCAWFDCEMWVNRTSVGDGDITMLPHDGLARAGAISGSDFNRPIGTIGSSRHS
jgi:hypothetical protein